MSGIFWEVSEHTLNIKPGSKPVKQGLRRFNEEKRKTIGEELLKLLTAGFVREVQHPDWIPTQFLYRKRIGNGGRVLTTRARRRLVQKIRFLSLA
jgi:hypothetical protein